MTDPTWIRPEVLVPLIAGHVIGDFSLQSDGMVAGKRQWGIRTIHAMVVAVVSFILLGYLPVWWWILPAIAVSHFLLDSAKTCVETATATCRWDWWKRNGSAALFLVDQAAHVVSLAAILWAASLVAPAKATLLGHGGWIGLFGPRYVKLLVLVTGFVLATQGSGYFLGTMLKRFEQEPEAGVPKGGYWIGVLERALIFIFILAGEPAGIGFLAAAKSVFRFGELKNKEDRKLAEYILIGTLMSFTFAMVIGYATKRVILVIP